MAKTLRNFWLDAALFLLLGLNGIVLVLGRGQLAWEEQLNLLGRLHAVSAGLLMIGCLVHIGLHTGWIRAVVAGRARGRIKLGMNGIVVGAMLLAGLTGMAGWSPSAAGRLHGVAGTLALLGLTIHAAKHARWMASTARNLTRRQRAEGAGLAAEGRISELNPVTDGRHVVAEASVRPGM